MELKQRSDFSKGIMRTLLSNRGFPEDGNWEFKDSHFYNPILKTKMIDKSEEIFGASARYFNNFIQQENHLVLVPIHTDTDSIVSSILLKEYLKRVGAKAKIKFIFHRDKGGSLKAAVEKLPKYLELYDDNLMIVCPDGGSSDYKNQEYLTNLGIHIIILDHHELYENKYNYKAKEDFLNVINHHTTDFFDDFKPCAAAVVWYFLRYCTYLFNGEVNSLIEDCLDLVAVALVADSIPLDNLEARGLISYGLDNVNSHFLSTFISNRKIKDLSPHDIGWYFSPLINAVMRIGEDNEITLLNKVFDSSQSQKIVPSKKRGHEGEDVILAEEAIRIFTNAKARQDKLVTKSIDSINPKLGKVILEELSLKEEQQPISGLIAMKLAEKYNRPTIVYYKSTNGYAGSMRVPNNFTLDFREFINNSNIGKAMGHARAAGVYFWNEQKIEKFRQYCEDNLPDDDLDVTYVDLLLEDKITNDTLSILKEIESVGSLLIKWGFEKPLVGLTVIIKDTQITVNNSSNGLVVKLLIKPGFNIICFKQTEEFVDSLKSAESVTVVGTVQTNEFAGRSSLQLIPDKIIIQE